MYIDSMDAVRQTDETTENVETCRLSHTGRCSSYQNQLREEIHSADKIRRHETLTPDTHEPVYIYIYIYTHTHIHAHIHTYFT